MRQELEEAARDNGIAIFEGRIITDAQPPASSEIVREIEARCGAALPPGLLALWRTSFGGALDYDLEVAFDGVVRAFSFTELFYPGSSHYHDLWGWMEHETTLAEEAADETGRTWDGKLAYLPFGGFEYLDRLYVCLEEGPDYGAVFAWAKGLPPAWTFALNKDSIARVADDVPALFRQLFLSSDPFQEGEEFRAGLEMAEVVDEIAAEHDALGAELTAIARAAVLDWRPALEDGTIASSPAALRLALSHASQNDDRALMTALFAQGCEIDEPLAGGRSLFEHAVSREPIDTALWLAELGADVGGAFECGAHALSREQAEEFLGRGARVTGQAAMAAARSGDIGTARILADALVDRDAVAARRLVDDLAYWAGGAEASAERIELGKLMSNISAQQYRDEGNRMRALRNHCAAVLSERKPRSGSGWLSRTFRRRP